MKKTFEDGVKFALDIIEKSKKNPSENLQNDLKNEINQRIRAYPKKSKKEM